MILFTEGGGGGGSKWITDRVYKLTSRLIKVFVDFLVPYFWTMSENQLEKVSTSPMLKANGVRLRGNLCDEAFSFY